MWCYGDGLKFEARAAPCACGALRARGTTTPSPTSRAGRAPRGCVNNNTLTYCYNIVKLYKAVSPFLVLFAKNNHALHAETYKTWCF